MTSTANARSAAAVDPDDWDTHYARLELANMRNPAIIYRQQLIDRLLDLRRGGADCRLLDIGTGQGDLFTHFVPRYPRASMVGVDGSAVGVQTASRRFPTVKFIQRDLLRACPSDDAYSQWATHAVCSEVLEHVDDPVALLRNAAEYLQEGSRLVITVPGGPMSAFDRHIGHRTHYTVDSLRGVIRAAGLIDIRLFSAGFPFFNLYRATIILRGAKLKDDVAGSDTHELSPVVRWSMWGFRQLFRANALTVGPGWQLAAICTKTGVKR